MEGEGGGRTKAGSKREEGKGERKGGKRKQVLPT